MEEKQPWVKAGDIFIECGNRSICVNGDKPRISLFIWGRGTLATIPIDSDYVFDDLWQFIYEFIEKREEKTGYKYIDKELR